MIGSWLMLAAATLAYHGELHDESGNPVTSKKLFPIEFRLYDAAEDGTLIWGRCNAVQLDDYGNFYTELADARGDQLSGAAYSTLDEALARCGFSGIWVEMKPDDARPIKPRTRLAQTLQAHRVLTAATADAIEATNALLTASRVTAESVSCNDLRVAKLEIGNDQNNQTLYLTTSGAQSVTISGKVSGPRKLTDQTEKVLDMDALRLYKITDNGHEEYVMLPVPAGVSLPAHRADQPHVAGYVFGKE